jgi:hypothetical protein
MMGSFVFPCILLHDYDLIASKSHARRGMKLNAYLRLRRWKPIDFAQHIGCGVDSVFRWKRGVVPSEAYQRIIEQLTEGKIGFSDWYDEEISKR